MLNLNLKYLWYALQWHTSAHFRPYVPTGHVWHGSPASDIKPSKQSTICLYCLTVKI